MNSWVGDGDAIRNPSHRMRILELTISGSGERRRYLLGPTP